MGCQGHLWPWGDCKYDEAGPKTRDEQAEPNADDSATARLWQQLGEPPYHAQPQQQDQQEQQHGKKRSMPGWAAHKARDDRRAEARKKAAAEKGKGKGKGKSKGKTGTGKGKRKGE